MPAWAMTSWEVPICPAPDNSPHLNTGIVDTREHAVWMQWCYARRQACAVCWWTIQRFWSRVWLEDMPSAGSGFPYVDIRIPPTVYDDNQEGGCIARPSSQTGASGAASSEGQAMDNSSSGSAPEASSAPASTPASATSAELVDGLRYPIEDSPPAS